MRVRAFNQAHKKSDRGSFFSEPHSLVGFFLSIAWQTHKTTAWLKKYLGAPNNVKIQLHRAKYHVTWQLLEKKLKLCAYCKNYKFVLANEQRQVLRLKMVSLRPTAASAQ